MILIDGSEGEGGGQILRTALSLSMATGQPFTLKKIRAGRAKPGLLRQHLACVRAAAEISNAQTEGAEIHSKALVFRPGPVRPGNYRFDIGSAGSTMLVLQTVLAALMRCGQPSAVTVTGGTHAMSAPSFDMFTHAFLPLLGKMGQRIEAICVRRGFYPAGGGEVRATIAPSGTALPLFLEDRGALVAKQAKALVAKLSYDIARREAEALSGALGWAPEDCIAHTDATALGPGNIITATLAHEQVTEVFTAHGRQGVSASQIAEELALDIKDYLGSGAAVGPHLADQLLLPMALCAGGRFVTLEPTEHCLTNIRVIRAFLDIPIDHARLDDRRWLVTVGARV
jgi:RNA 3'-terminal phosphate cyclase (ATP)